MKTTTPEAAIAYFNGHAQQLSVKFKNPRVEKEKKKRNCYGVRSTSHYRKIAVDSEKQTAITATAAVCLSADFRAVTVLLGKADENKEQKRAGGRIGASRQQQQSMHGGERMPCRAAASRRFVPSLA